jgi:hypothetical protein
MKTGPYALGTAENLSGSAKHENGTRSPRYRKTLKLDPTPSVPLKTDPGAQNMKMRPGASDIAKNEPGSAKHENEI